MNLTRFAFNNVIRNKKAYFAYFLSSTISATLFFSFTMLLMHPNLENKEFPSDIKSALLTTELIAYIFLILFVFYSVSVFLKNRNREFGTLFILGTSKVQLIKLIFFENIIIIGVSGMVGVIFGISFSKFFLLAISEFLRIYDMEFYFPSEAILTTIGAFLLLGVAISFLAAFVIRENQVLKLLKGNKTPKKEPKTSQSVAVASIIALVLAYYFAATATTNNLGDLVMPVTIVTIVATYFIFSQLSVFILRLLKGNRPIYMKKNNLIWISNLYYRVKDNVRMSFIITITSAVAFTSIGALYAIMNRDEERTLATYPQAITYIVTNFKDLSKQEEGSNENNINPEIIKAINDKNIKFIDTSLKNEKIKYDKFVGERKVVRDSRDSIYTLTLMTESQYNALASSLNLSEITLRYNEAFKVAHDKTEQMNENSKKDFTLNGENFKVIGEGKKNVLSGFYEDSYVVKDEVFNKIEDYFIKEDYTAYFVEDWYSTLDVAKKIYNGVDTESDYRNYRVSSSAVYFESGRKQNGLNLLVVLFIGILFFFTTGSFLYNKFYMDVNEDKKKFKDMSKVGVAYSDIKRIITIELGAMFFTPYIIAIIHSSFALSALKNAKNIDVTLSAFLVMGSFFLIQIVYFMVIRAMYLKEIRRELG